MTDTPEEASYTEAEAINQAVATIDRVQAAKEPRPNEVVVIAVKGIIAITSAALIGAIVLVFKGSTVPDGIIAIGSAGVGSLSTLLTVSSRETRSPSRKTD